MAKVVHAHFRPLFRASLGLGFPKADAEDLVQEVFATFLETLDRFEGRSSIRTWLFGILHRKVQERRREQTRENRTDPIEEVFESRFRPDGTWSRPPVDLDQHMRSIEIGRAVKDCMNQLPRMQREVFVLRDVESVETDEVCKILQISRTNMFVQVFRARARLRECLERKLQEPKP